MPFNVRCLHLHLISYISSGEYVIVGFADLCNAVCTAHRVGFVPSTVCAGCRIVVPSSFVLAESFATRVGLPRLVYKKSGSMSLWRQELVSLLSLTAFCFPSSLFQKSVDYSAVSRFLD